MRIGCRLAKVTNKAVPRLMTAEEVDCALAAATTVGAVKLGATEQAQITAAAAVTAAAAAATAAAEDLAAPIQAATVEHTQQAERQERNLRNALSGSQLGREGVAAAGLALLEEKRQARIQLEEKRQALSVRCNNLNNGVW